VQVDQGLAPRTSTCCRPAAAKSVSRSATPCPKPGRATRKPASRRRSRSCARSPAIYPNYIQIVASADSGIKTLADLKGKRISVGAPKSGTELNARAIFKAAGLSYKDFAKVEYLPFGESVELMKNRQLDATLHFRRPRRGRDPRPGHVAAEDRRRPIPAEVVAKIGDAAYQPVPFPPTPTAGRPPTWPTVADPELPGHARGRLRRMTPSTDDQVDVRQPDTMVAAHNAAKAINKRECGQGQPPVPLHPGAEKYYREVGLIK
jgi:hypothetical protein